MPDDTKETVAAHVAGVLTVREPMMMCDGTAYKYIWSSAWAVLSFYGRVHYVVRTPVVDGGGGGDILAAVPAELVTGFAACSVNPMFRGGAPVCSVEPPTSAPPGADPAGGGGK